MKSRASYNPATGEIRATVTAYQIFHEYAHLDQHCRGTLLWRLRWRLLGIPWIERVANLGVEIEAALLAWRDLKACGIWFPEDGREARDGIAAYARDLFL